MREHAYGAIPSPKDSRDYKAKEYLNMGVLPDEYLPDKYAPVINQYNVSSCVAHALSTMKWYQEEREKRSNREFSTDFIYHNRTEEDWQGKGMYMREGCKHLCEDGVVLKKDLPTNTEYPNMGIKNMVKGLKDKALPYNGTKYISLSDKNDIKEAIFQYGACVLSIHVPVSFDAFWFKSEKDMKLPMPKSDEDKVGYHAICAFGYTKDGILIQNSWGEAWGNNGVAIIPWSYPLNEAWVVVDKIKDWDIIELQIDNKEYTFNGEVKESDVAPTIKDNRTLVPLRLIGEILGAEVDYWEKDKKIIIRKER